jgi:hypothetical protein
MVQLPPHPPQPPPPPHDEPQLDPQADPHELVDKAVLFGWNRFA